MNINLFFVTIFMGLLAIFTLFEPLDIKEQKFVELPLFELQEFSLRELNTTALTTFMSGENALRYSDRYEVKRFYFVDNAKKYISNLQSNYGIYKDSKITLKGDVEFVQKDGLTFQTQKAIFDRDTDLLRTEGEYKLFREKDSFEGRDLYYYRTKNSVKSKDITAIYQLQEDF